MKEVRELKSFFYSQYLADGFRITFGALLPTIILSHLGHIEAGMAVSIGALYTSIPDNPGAIIHRRNSMFICIICLTLISLLTGLINDFPVLIGFEIFIMCFFFSMFSIYGNRAGAIGTAALLMMVINIDRSFTLSELAGYTGFVLLGGLWYMALSLSLAQMRPYREAQNTLAECIAKVAGYIRIKADLYDESSNFDEVYKHLANQQIEVHQEQEKVREILFKNRMFIRDPTNTARVLILVFLDIIDIYEQAMATHYDYREVRKRYAQTGILKEYKQILLHVARELDNLSYDININERPRLVNEFLPELDQLKQKVDGIENNFLLKKILITIRKLTGKQKNIYSYFNKKELKPFDVSNEKDLGRFVSKQTIDPALFIENLNFRSSVFRHSVRVAIVALAGFCIAKLLPMGHYSYWILLTIVVILKPAFSLTKKRNYQRIIGTLLGGLIGAFIVYFVKDPTVRFLFLMLFMLGTYSFQRLNYVVSVICMTPYVILMFSLVQMGSLSVVEERVVDTIIGSLISFAASYFIFPTWEYKKMHGYMQSLLLANYRYFLEVIDAFNNVPIDVTDYKLARKNIYVASANMSSAFQRMTSEPKGKQRNLNEISKFIVLNHSLTSYIATLMVTARTEKPQGIYPAQARLIRQILYHISDSVSALGDSSTEVKDAEQRLKFNTILETEENNDDSLLITEQLYFISKTTKDILKSTKRFSNS